MIYLQVPGRVGLLLTAYLIASNVYSSVQAPQSRGFCFIDVWMVGVQISILTAIFEYGIVLALIRATKDKNQPSKSRTIQVCVTGCTFVQDDSSKKSSTSVKVAQLVNSMDKWTMIISALFFLLFNLAYWGYALQMNPHLIFQ